MTSALSVTHPDSEAPDLAGARPAAEDYQGPLVNLRALRTAVWRRWRTWLTVGLIGMMFGAGLHFILPAKYSAKAEVYLTYPGNADPLTSSANDVSLAQTTAVAQEAIDRLHLHMTTLSFLSSYTVVAESNAILSITSSGPSASAAVARANTTAQAFLAVRNRERRLQTHLTISGLQAQIGSLQSQVGTLTDEINNLQGGTGSSTANQLTQLTNQQGSDQAQISQLQGQIQQAQLDLTSVIRGSSVIDPATASPVSRKKVIVMDGLTGLIIGIGSAMMILLLGLLLSDRLRTREDVAAVLGAPVELSVADRLRGAHGRYLVDPPVPLLMIERRLKDRLEAAPGAALAVVEVGAASTSALAVARLAHSLASQDRRVMIIDMARGRPLASLFGGGSTIAEGQYTVPVGNQHILLTVGPEDPAEAAETLAVPEGADAVLVLTTIDPALSVDYLAKWAVDAVVIVDTKKASASLIGSTGELLRQAGISIKSALIVGGDPRDETVGSPGTDAVPLVAEQVFADRRPIAT